MDYPHPYVEIDNDVIDFSKAYDQKIGDWDKRTILYGYGYPDSGESEDAFLQSVLAENSDLNYLFITDKDARPKGGLHPYAHLWDNGTDPIGELERISVLRNHVLDNMGINSIKEGVPYSEIEKTLVPAYLMHRYQVDAVAKLIGGYHFEYSEKPEPVNFKSVDMAIQKKALQSLLNTLDVDFLMIPKELTDIIPPVAYGYPRTRESFKGTTGSLLDPISAAEAVASYTLSFLLDPQRLARIDLAGSDSWNLNDYIDDIIKYIAGIDGNDKYKMMLEKTLFIHLLQLKMDHSINKQVNAEAAMSLNKIIVIEKKSKSDRQAHSRYLTHLLSDSNKELETFKIPTLAKMPPGSPIGCH